MQPMNGWNDVARATPPRVDGGEDHLAPGRHARRDGCAVLAADAHVDRAVGDACVDPGDDVAAERAAQLPDDGRPAGARRPGDRDPRPGDREARLQAAALVGGAGSCPRRPGPPATAAASSTRRPRSRLTGPSGTTASESVPPSEEEHGAAGREGGGDLDALAVAGEPGAELAVDGLEPRGARSLGEASRRSCSGDCPQRLDVGRHDDALLEPAGPRHLDDRVPACRARPWRPGRRACAPAARRGPAGCRPRSGRRRRAAAPQPASARRAGASPVRPPGRARDRPSV